MFRISNDAVETLFLPHMAPSLENSVDLPRGVPLSSLQVDFQRISFERVHDEMDVIRHDHDRSEIRFFTIMQKRILQNFACPFIAQQAIANTLIEPMLDHGDGMTGDLLPSCFAPGFSVFT